MTSTTTDDPDQTVEVVVGVLGRAHGIRGDVEIHVRTDEPERRFVPGARLRVEGATRVLTVESARNHSGRLLVRFEELVDRTAAEGARGLVLLTDVVEHERTVAADIAREEGKPEKIIDRIVEGRLGGFFKENCLLDQPAISDDKKTVAQTLEAAGVTLKRFVRFSAGE